MKKKIFAIAAIAAAILTACNVDSIASLDENAAPEEIGLRVRGMQTKSAINGTAFPIGYDMLVSAYKNLGSHAGEDVAATYFEGIRFGAVNTTEAPADPVYVWKSEMGAKYWPLDGSLDFLAIACAGLNSSSTGIVPTCVWGDASGNDAAKVVVTVPDNSAKFDDLLFSYLNDEDPSAAGADMTFNHAMTSVVFLAKCNVAYNAGNNAGITINSITIDGAKYSGTLTLLNPEAGGGSGSFSAAWSGVSTATPASSGAWDHIAARVWNAANLGTNVSEAALSALNLGTTYKDMASYPFGEAYVVMPEQSAVPFTINYTIHNGLQADGSTPDDVTLEYQYTPSGTWEMGKKYVFQLDFTLTEIIINPVVVDWDTQSASTVAIP